MDNVDVCASRKVGGLEARKSDVTSAGSGLAGSSGGSWEEEGCEEGSAQSAFRRVSDVMSRGNLV